MAAFMSLLHLIIYLICEKIFSGHQKSNPVPNEKISHQQLSSFGTLQKELTTVCCFIGIVFAQHILCFYNFVLSFLKLAEKFEQ